MPLCPKDTVAEKGWDPCGRDPFRLRSLAAWALALTLLATPALSLASNPLEGTAHQFEFGSIEPDESGCSSLCHTFLDPELQHDLSQVEAAWKTALSGDDLTGVVSLMCASCHRSGGGYSATMQSAFSDENVYHLESHGRKLGLDGSPAATEPQASGLPRVSAGSINFECSTCHNPHSDANRPFLTEDMNRLCARCHTQRNFIGGQEFSGSAVQWGVWGLPEAGGDDNPGSHPVGEDIVPSGPDAPPVTVDGRFRTAISDTPGTWSLGPHLSMGDTGSVTCMTCHAVHGFDPDTESAVAGTPWPPNPQLLSVAQATGSIPGYDRPAANGDEEGSTLCEACHGAGNNPDQGPGGISWSDEDFNVHPGLGGLFSHPTDTYPSYYELTMPLFPPGWPKGPVQMSAHPSALPLICESCHAAHPAAALQAGRPDVLTGAGAYLLRAPLSIQNGGALLCDQCHTGELPGHHPVNRTYDSSGVSYLMNARMGTADTLTCATCHTGAHNWTQPGWASLDPGWLPFDNGRRTVQAEDMFHPEMGKTCMDCHYFMDGDGTSVSPTMGTRKSTVDPSDPEHVHYQTVDFGNGTHYIGMIHDLDDEKRFFNPLIDTLDTGRTWKVQGSSDFTDGLADGWSRFGGENAPDKVVLVCESCHELEPDRNGGFTHLLLAPYEEGRNGLDEYTADDDGMDVLCLACHGVGSGSHPMTDGTDEPDLSSIHERLIGYATMSRDSSQFALSCDSCHQPHDANNLSRTYILDGPERYNANGLNFLTVEEGTMMNGYGEVRVGSIDYREADGTPGGYTTPRTTPGMHHGICMQCHDK